VGGSVFKGADASLSGVVVFDQSGQAGAINLVSGSTIATGAWDCKDAKVS
jgi:hypothetical protein